VQEIAKKNDIVFILDETVTGFASPRGLPTYYGLNPTCDLRKALVAGFRWRHLQARGNHGQTSSAECCTMHAQRLANRLHAARANLRKLSANNGEVFDQSGHSRTTDEGITDLFRRMGTARSSASGANVSDPVYGSAGDQQLQAILRVC